MKRFRKWKRFFVLIPSPPTTVATSATHLRWPGEPKTLEKSWETLARGPLVQLNTAFTAAGMPAIKPDSTPETQQEHGEEE